MRYPSVENLFEDMFDDFEDDMFGTGLMPRLGKGRGRGQRLMPYGNCLMGTDVREEDKNYLLDINMPGFKKEDIKVKLADGMLTVSASNEHEDNDESDKKYVRHERYSGSVSRSWYVGDEMKQEDIKAKFADGVLTLSLPKLEEKKELPEKDSYIAIEG